MNPTKRRRDSSHEPPETMTRLPDELIMEILTWVPGRELGRSKCVCTLWKSLIGSTQFLTLYRRRNRCLMIYWSEAGRMHFHYSSLRSYRTDFEERFHRLGSLPVSRNIDCIDPVTQLVNGVICSGQIVNGEVQFKVISVCTGQALRIPSPEILPLENVGGSSYHLGYDPRSKRYKLLRLYFSSYLDMRAEVITLGPTGTVWEWRKLDDDGAGIRQLSPTNDSVCDTMMFGAVPMFSGDGVLCWVKNLEIILFDLNKEVFRWVKLPNELNDDENRMMVPRVQMEDKHLAIHLWALPRRGKGDADEHEHEHEPECECFVLEDDKGNVWKKSSVRLRSALRFQPDDLSAANGSPFTASGSSIMLMNSHSLLAFGRRRDVYYTNTKGMRRFWVGQLPVQLATRRACNADASIGCAGRLSCLLDSNVLYLSLKDVLNGTGLI